VAARSLGSIAHKRVKLYEQAYHTSCRTGLSSQPGFQFNAASPGLSKASLDALATAHAGYHAPRDLPLEPNAAELSRFPISLRYQPVDGLGPVVSRTAYVGREFRSFDGTPDTGRFGNYFSHILVAPDAGDPFDGLLPIELWGAEHWVVTESSDSALASLPKLTQGGLDLARTLELLDPVRRRWVPEIVAAVSDAVRGGPSVIVVDEPGEAAAAWVALASFALPRADAASLTFTTFEGRPRYSEVNLTVTTPGCDVAFPSYELDQRVRVFDVCGGEAAPDEAPLIGRVVGALLESGEEALATTTRLAASLGPVTTDELAAAMVVVAGLPELIRSPEEVASVIRAITKVLRDNSDIRLAVVLNAMASEDAVAPQAQITEWCALFVAARSSGHGEASDAVDSALGLLIPQSEFLNAELVALEAEPSGRLPLGRLAGWLTTVVEEVNPAILAARIQGGLSLGFVGANTELDRQLAEVFAQHLPASSIRRAFDLVISQAPASDVPEAVAHSLAQLSTEAPETLALLEDLVLAHPALAPCVTEWATQAQSFAAGYVEQRVQISIGAQTPAAAVSRLAEFAREPGDQAQLRAMYGPRGPGSSRDHAALLRAYADAGQQPPTHDLSAAWAALADLPLRVRGVRAGGEELAAALEAADMAAKNHATMIAWRAAASVPAPGPSGDLDLWMDRVAAVNERPHSELPDERWDELLALAGDAMLVADPTDHLRAFSRCVELATLDVWWPFYAELLAEHLGHERDPARAAASFFTTWEDADQRSSERKAVLDEALPVALSSWSPRQREAVADHLPEDLTDRWQEWNETHPPAGAVSRVVGRLFRRGGADD
jgi:GTPase-associated protein 1, N-terminal domain type 2/GTPase-associated protein 1, middle domain